MKKRIEVGEYRGFAGVAEWDEERNYYYGTTTSGAVITFVGKNEKEARREFEFSVDYYYKWKEKNS